MNQDFNKILPLILALLLIFIIPMIMVRTGMTWEDLLKRLFGSLKKQELKAVSSEQAKKNKRTPRLFNSRSGELKELVSTLLVFVRRNKLNLVYPGTITDGKDTATLLALLVTKERVYGINCFGYSGEIYEQKGTQWKQKINGTEVQFQSPLLLNKKQYDLVRKVMDANGMKDVPLSILACFTNRDAEMHISSRNVVYQTKDMIAMLKEKVAEENDVIDPDAIGKQLHALVSVVKPTRR